MKPILIGQAAPNSRPSSRRRPRSCGRRDALKALGAALSLGFVVSASRAASADWPHHTTAQLLDKSALVGVFTAKLVDPNAYDRALDKARTRVVFGVNLILKGKWQADTIEFVLPGGFYPNGDEEVWSDLPEFTEGEKYLLFIQGGKWHTTPIVAGNQGAYRVAKVGEREVFVNGDGFVVSYLSEYGFRLAPRRVTRSERDLKWLRAGVDPRTMPKLKLDRVAREDTEQELVLSELRRQIKGYQARAALRSAGRAGEQAIQHVVTPMPFELTRSTP